MEDPEVDWKILRRDFVDAELSSTLNVAEGFERILKALRTLLDLKSVASTPTMKLDFKVDKGVFLYKVCIVYPSMTLHCEDTFKELNAINNGPFFPEVEAAIESVFNGLSKVLKNDARRYAVEIETQEERLARMKRALHEMHQNIAKMGKFDRSQRPLAFKNPSIPCESIPCESLPAKSA